MSTAPADTFTSQALPFQIKVIEGDLSVAQLQPNQPPGVISLAGPGGRAGPLQANVSWEVKQRTSLKYPPGNPVGTQQAIGPTYSNLVVTGEWNDRFLGDGAAMSLRALFESIVARGLSVEVSWGHGLGGTVGTPSLTTDPIVRVGMIVRFKPSPIRPQDVPWEMEFEWRSNGGQSTSAISATAQLNPRAGFADVLNDSDEATAMWTAVQNGPQVRKVGLPQSALDAMSRAFEAVDTAGDQIQTASGAIVSAVVIPAAAAQQLIGSCKSTMDALALMTTTILTINLTALEVVDSALDIIRIKDSFFDVLAQCDQASETCYDAGTGISVNVQPDVMAQVQAIPGTDLRDLAAQYYGTPELWWLIAQANDIDGSAVPAAPTGASDQPNRPLIIPRPQSGTSSNLTEAC